MPPLNEEKTEEMVELESIIDDVCKEMKFEEEIINEIPEDIQKQYEEMETIMNNPQQATNNEILKQALLNRSKVQDIESCLVYFKAKENEHFVEEMKELHYIRKHMDKFALISLGIVFACGYIFGTQHEHISPYIVKIIDLINIFKGNGGANV